MTRNIFPTLLLLAFLALKCTTVKAQADSEPATISLTEASLRGPAVASILDSPRETPAQQLNAIFTLLDLVEVDVARTLWKDFGGEELADSTKAALVNEFGVARFLKLARRETASDLTGARDFTESCLQAKARLNGDPKRLAKLIGDLSDESAEVRRAARSDLAVAGDAGAIACVEALAQATDAQLRTELMLTLAKMRPGVEPMLIAALADGRGQLRRDVVELAGYLHLQDTVPLLAAIAAGADSEPTVVSAAYAALSKMGLSVPNAPEALALIRGEIHLLETGFVPNTGTDAWWTWRHETPPITAPGPGKLVAREVSLEMINRLAINRLASNFRLLGEPSPEDRRKELIYWLETAEVSGLAEDRRWDEISTLELSETLSRALQGDHLRAAVVCVSQLGRRAEAATLDSVAGQRGPLASALVHPNRELRYAALEAIMKISPQQSFAGASGISPALWYFAAGAGTPQAIAASSVVTRASDWAGQLRGLSYDATPVATGREALLTALNSPRLELILVDSDIGRPLVREVIYELRSNPQIARVPIAILSSLHNLLRAEQIAEQDRWLLATPRPHSDDAMQIVLAQLADLGEDKLSPEGRTEQASAALGWIAKLLETVLENGHPYDELLREAALIGETLYNPDLTAASLRVLSVLGTADSQRLLIDYVSSPTVSIGTRREAADAMAKSVERFGKLLTSEEIRRQYDRYNASETADRETQKVLGGVLDILEKQ